MSQAAMAYTARAAAVIRKGDFSPTLVKSFTVVSALMAVPPMPAPNTPIASPRRSGGNHALTKGTPTANTVPPNPRKKPPTSRAPYELSPKKPIRITGTIVSAEITGNMIRPPNRSVIAPTGIRPSEPTTTGTATRRATSDSDSFPRLPVVRNSGPSGLSSAQAQKLTANPSVAIANITWGLPDSLLVLVVWLERVVMVSRMFLSSWWCVIPTLARFQVSQQGLKTSQTKAHRTLSSRTGPDRENLECERHTSGSEQ